MRIESIINLLAPIERRIKTMLTRGIIKLINTDLMLQEIQVQVMGTTLDEIEYFEPYGFTSAPNEGGEVLLASLGGRRGHTVAVCVSDRRFRLKSMVQGEVALFTDEGDVIHFKRNNILHINSAAKVEVVAPEVDITASTKVTLTTPTCEITGDLSVGGNVTAGGDVSDVLGSMQIMRLTYNGHTHTGDTGGSTSIPLAPMT